jgi:hypothetical protein
MVVMSADGRVKRIVRLVGWGRSLKRYLIGKLRG